MGVPPSLSLVSLGSQVCWWCACASVLCFSSSICGAGAGCSSRLACGLLLRGAIRDTGDGGEELGLRMLPSPPELELEQDVREHFPLSLSPSQISGCRARCCLLARFVRYLGSRGRSGHQPSFEQAWRSRCRSRTNLGAQKKEGRDLLVV